MIKPDRSDGSIEGLAGSQGARLQVSVQPRQLYSTVDLDNLAHADLTMSCVTSCIEYSVEKTATNHTAVHACSSSDGRQRQSIIRQQQSHAV